MAYGWLHVDIWRACRWVSPLNTAIGGIVTAVQMFDKDRSGQIDVKEFMIGLSNFTGAGKEEKLKFAFMVFDEDGNGVITKQELLKILKANHMASSDSEVIRKAETIMMQVR